MIRPGLLSGTLLLVVSMGCADVDAQEPANYLGETPSQAEARLQWWREARFGIFVTWGPVSLLREEIGWSRGGARPGQGGTGTVPVATYDQLYRRFNPSLFSAQEWTDAFHAAGARYVIYLTKHHDGFNMYDTRLSGYKITSPDCPFGRDVAGELAEACRKAGLKLTLYYSLGDWFHPDYYTDRHDRFMDYLNGQIEELCTRYGEVYGFWFDLWFPKFTGEDAQRMANTIHRLQPRALLNDRFGMPGDYDTPEQRVGLFQNTRPWESCITLGTQWSWKPDDKLKSFDECIRLLVQCAGGDGNLALNVNPMPDGRIEPRQLERLREMGVWLAAHGESIYGTHGGPYMPGDYGACTCKDNRVFVHLLDTPPGRIVLPPLPKSIRRVSLLTGGQAEAVQTDESVVLAIPEEHRHSPDTIAVFELAGAAADITPIRTASGSAAFARPASASGWQRGRGENLDWNERQNSPAMAFDGDPQTAWNASDGDTTGWLAVDLGDEQRIDEAVFFEPVPGRIGDFDVERKVDGRWVALYSGHGLGMQAVIRFAPVAVREIRINVRNASGPPAIAEWMLTGPDRPARKRPEVAPAWVKAGASNVRGNLRDHGPDKAFGGGQYVAMLGKEPVWVDIDFGKDRRLDLVTVNTSYGENVEHYEVKHWEDGHWRTLCKGTGPLAPAAVFSFEPTFMRQLQFIFESSQSKLFNIWNVEFRDADPGKSNN